MEKEKNQIFLPQNSAASSMQHDLRAGRRGICLTKRMPGDIHATGHSFCFYLFYLRLQRKDSKHYCKQHAENGENPYIAEGSLDVILDIHICQTNTEQGCRYHRADEGCTVTAYNHRYCDRERLNSKDAPIAIITGSIP